MAINPKSYTPSALVAKLLTQGRPPFAAVPFPRYDAAGSPIAHVHVRLLSQAEEEIALANARQEHARLLQNSDAKEDPELLHNLRVAWLLAEACRDVDDPSKRFFEHGIAEVRQFNSEELAQLALVYAGVKEQAWPALRELSEGELELWIKTIAEGSVAHPFHWFSRNKLEIFSASVVRCLVELRASTARSTGSSGEASSAPSSA